MKCPHCHESFFVSWQPMNPQVARPGQEDTDGFWWTEYTTCPTCQKLIMKLVHTTKDRATSTESLFRPKAMARTPLPPEIPELFAADYREACLVLADSPKA